MDILINVLFVSLFNSLVGYRTSKKIYGKQKEEAVRCTKADTYGSSFEEECE